MNDQDAMDLILKGVLQNPGEKQVWADLGCGSGVFTKALATLLYDESTIFAVDKNIQSLQAIPEKINNVTILKNNLDFEVDDYPFNNLDGVLMANSIHYVADKHPLFQKIYRNIRKGGCLIIVEYEVAYASPFVPYPVKMSELKLILKLCGFNKFLSLGEKKSRYGHTIYSIECKK